MNKKTIVLVVVLVLAMLMGTLWFGMWLGEQKAEQSTAGSQIVGGNAPIPPPPASSPPMPSLNQASPPWAGSTIGPSVLDSVQGRPAQIERQKQMAELKAMQLALMKSMQETNRADPKQVDALLLKIKQVTGSSTVNGVDIDALRNNLLKAGKMQIVATEMNREATRPGGGDPNKIKAYADQLRALQPQTFIAPAVQAKPAPELAR